MGEVVVFCNVWIMQKKKKSKFKSQGLGKFSHFYLFKTEGN